YPNPFNSEIRIPITLDAKSSAELTIMSLRGRELWSRDVKGSVQLSWKGLDQNGRALPTGTYLIVMQSGTQQIVEQITLLK
ncbi:MAG: T9SS type A sorting domain-containing protein, partial [Candidatus Marinimicrobia bacterium]|nr:T9SS type A sorting domain-containing protein [Candidatus Neomarinimicrobiota bacterium]